jgi:hypothetical protein
MAESLSEFPEGFESKIKLKISNLQSESLRHSLIKLIVYENECDFTLSPFHLRNFSNIAPQTNLTIEKTYLSYQKNLIYLRIRKLTWQRPRHLQIDLLDKVW